MALVAAVCWAAAGCSSGTQAVGKTAQGTLLVDGQPAASAGEDEGGGFEVQFYPLDESGQLKAGGFYTAHVGEGGKFTVAGHNNEDLPAGKYRVAVLSYAPGSSDEGAKDLLGGKYSKDKSTIEVDVQSGVDFTVEIQTAGGAAPAEKPTS